MNNKFILLTFADSSLNLSLRRIKKQAENLNFYDEIIAWNEKDIDTKFRSKFKDRLKLFSKGYGYWAWKPQIILQALDKVEMGDIIQYTDSGCHLNIKGKKRLLEYFEMTKELNPGILAFQAKLPEYPLNILPEHYNNLLDDYKWAKGDLIDYLNVRNNKEVLYTPTIGAGILFIRKDESSIRIIKDWLSVIESDFKFIDDTKSVSENLPGFIEHRHDQAIFSILAKLNGVKTLSSYEYHYPKIDSKKPDWIALKDYPIHAKRDKKFGVINRFKKIMYKFLT